VISQLSQLPHSLPLAKGEPAGGAEIGQIIIATAMAAVALGGLAWAVHRYRSGTGRGLERAARWFERVSGLPMWAALPSAVSAISLVTAMLGFYWDVSLHIDEGRDAGPLANPAHYLILGGLFGIFAAGYLAISLPREGERPGKAAIKITDGWYAPVGGVLILACGVFALAGFPLDDLWHRIFGQDVTLWGPTHLMMVGGAAMTTIAQSVLLAEGLWERRRMEAAGDATGDSRGSTPLVTQLRRIAIGGALLIGLSAFQAEFDFGVPQFRLIFQPLLLAFSAGFALVMARIWIGRGGALSAVAFFIIGRGIVSLIVGPVFGETTPVFPLYIVEALLIEAAALWLGRERPLALGVTGGLLAGTVGFAAEYGWSHVIMPIPWTTDILPEGLIVAVIAGVSGGVIGGLFASALRGKLPRLARPALVAALVAFMAVVANGLITTEPQGSASMRLDKSAGGEEATATVRLDPPDLADDPAWFQTMAWQGGGLEISEMDQVSDGVYRTAEPVPISGQWKAILRLQYDRTIAAVPIYAPADPEIPVKEIPAKSQFQRDFIPDKEILQRELKSDVPGFLWPAASGFVLICALGFAWLLAWGTARVARADEGAPTPPAAPAELERRRRAPAAPPLGGRA
jgi:hypothetical protein